MTRTLRTLMLAGLGALDLTEEKLHAAYDDLVHRGELHEKDAKDLAAAWKKRAQERRDALAREVRDIVNEEIKRHNLTHRTELDQLAEHVARLEQRVSPAEEVPAR
ncbi:MAG: phasin family protein [Vicinamibacterales bacterium]